MRRPMHGNHPYDGADAPPAPRPCLKAPAHGGYGPVQMLSVPRRGLEPAQCGSNRAVRSPCQSTARSRSMPASSRRANVHSSQWAWHDQPLTAALLRPRARGQTAAAIHTSPPQGCARQAITTPGNAAASPRKSPRSPGLNGEAGPSVRLPDRGAPRLRRCQSGVRGRSTASIVLRPRAALSVGSLPTRVGSAAPDAGRQASELAPVTDPRPAAVARPSHVC